MASPRLSPRTLPGIGSPRLPPNVAAMKLLPPGWCSEKDDQGRTYFYHEDNPFRTETYKRPEMPRA